MIHTVLYFILFPGLLACEAGDDLCVFVMVKQTSLAEHNMTTVQLQRIDEVTFYF